MAKVSDWFDEWAFTLRSRSGRSDWLDSGSEAGRAFWDDFENAFVRMGATFDLADQASSIACDVPDLYPNQFRAMIVEAIRKLQKDKQSALNAGPSGSLDEAKAASKDCPDCLGNGFAVRYVHADIHGKVKTHGGHEAPIGMGVSYPCSCPLGHLAAAGLKPQGAVRDVLTVDQYPTLRMDRVRWSDDPDNKYRHRPADWDEESGMPVSAGEYVTRDMAIANLKNLSASFRASRSPATRSEGVTTVDRTSGDDRATTGTPGPSRTDPQSLSIPEDELGWF